MSKKKKDKKFKDKLGNTVDNLKSILNKDVGSSTYKKYRTFDNIKNSFSFLIVEIVLALVVKNEAVVDMSITLGISFAAIVFAGFFIYNHVGKIKENTNKIANIIMLFLHLLVVMLIALNLLK